MISPEKITQLEQQITNERRRVSTDRLDISFGEIINLYKNKELIIRPEYQRLFRWSSSQKTALIESILLSIPIPPIFVAEDKDGVWELIDGLQRISTIISFFGELEHNVSAIDQIEENENPVDHAEGNEEIEEDDTIEVIDLGNKWALNEAGIISSLEDFTVETMPGKFLINIKRAVCRVEILRGESSTSMKYELFKRLNSGGTKLNPQEIRNAIFRGIDTRLNELLLKLSRDSRYKDLTNLSLKKKMELYDQELILRFFAFLDNAESINKNTENYLTEFMEKAVKDPNFDYTSYENRFSQVLDIITSVNNPNIFRNSKNLFVPAEFEGITIGLAQNIDRFSSNLGLLIDKINELKSDPDFKRYSGSASNSQSRIKNRLIRVQQIFSS